MSLDRSLERAYLIIANSALIRPEIETEITTQSRVPSLLIADLIRQYDSLFPTLVKRKKAEGERIMPVRKRTKPMDRRISRSAIEEGGDGKQLLEKQLAMQRSPPVSEIRPASQVLEHTATATLQSEPRQRISLSDKPMASPVASEFPESAKSPSEPKRVALQDPPVATETRHRVTLSDFPVPIASPIADMPMRPMSSGFNRTDENALQDLIDSHQASDHDIGTSEEGHGSGAGRFARQRQVAREDRPISETEASLSRSGSGENARVKGPRGAATGGACSFSLAADHLHFARRTAATADRPSHLCQPGQHSRGKRQYDQGQDCQDGREDIEGERNDL